MRNKPRQWCLTQPVRVPSRVGTACQTDGHARTALLTRSVSWATASPCPFILTSLCFSSTRLQIQSLSLFPLPLLFHIPLQNSTLARSPLPGQLLTMWSTCWWKNQLVKMTFFLFTEQKNTNWLFKVMREPPHTKPNDLAEMFTFQLLMWVLCRQNPN